jgi:hypothetical protein
MRHAMNRAVTRRLAARLGLFAVLFQALLFGWHHHDRVFAGTGPRHAIVQNGAATTHPADDEDGCEICQVLHHQTASTGDLIVVALPGFAALPLPADAPVFVVRTLALAFRARAPPSSDADHG